MMDNNDIPNGTEDFAEYEELNFAEFGVLDLKDLPQGVFYHIIQSDFPECYISRIGNKLQIRIEEHFYTKYWFHKYHASVFAEAMIKAIIRLRIEGIPFSDEEFDEDDISHLFVRWTLTEPANINGDTLLRNINIAFDIVFERANSMLENSDSVLILGKDTGEGLEILKRIQLHLENLGFYTYIIKDQPDIIGESVMQKVLRFGLSSRFVIIENSQPSGHLYEFPHITKFAELTSIVLQRQGVGSTWMFEDLYHRLQNIKKIEYNNDNFESQINVGIEWANEYLRSFGNYQKEKLPWLKVINKEE